MFYKSPDGNYMPLVFIVCHLYNPFSTFYLFLIQIRQDFYLQMCAFGKDAIRKNPKLCIFRKFSIEPDVFMFLEFICLFFMSRSVRAVLKLVQVRLLNTSSRTIVDQYWLRMVDSSQLKESLLKKFSNSQHLWFNLHKDSLMISHH